MKRWEKKSGDGNDVWCQIIDFIMLFLKEFYVIFAFYLIFHDVIVAVAAVFVATIVGQNINFIINYY